MAPLPQNSTARLFFDYVTGNATTSQEHTFAVRMSGTAGDIANVQERVRAVLIAMGTNSFRDGWRILGVRYQAAGTDFSNPVTLIANLVSFVGTSGGAYDPRMEAVEDTFQGRSTTSGRRVDFSLYRALSDAPSNFRWLGGTTGFPAAVRAGVTALNASVAVGAFIAIDGSAVVWRDYLNANYNSYWERRIRTV